MIYLKYDKRQYMNHLIMKSPVGKLTLVASESGICAVLWEKEKQGRVKIDLGELNPKNKILQEAKRQLEEYFKGKRSSFDLPLDLIGTDFQKKVWKALSKIPFGQTHSYLDIAKKLKNKNASRAVGMANGKNPISIIVPCHRVIGNSGKLTGYAGGLEAKKILLDLEK